MDEIALFNRYKDAGMYPEALLIGQNLFNKNSNNTEIFNAYFDLLISLIEKESDSIEIQKHYCDKAEIALAFYSENVNLDDFTIKSIMTKTSDIQKLRERINQHEHDILVEITKKKISENAECLSMVSKYLVRLHEANTRADFNTILQQIEKVDALIEKDYLTTEQNDLYRSLSKECSELVNSKLRAFDYQDDKDYNLKAIAAFEKVFMYFKNNDASSYPDNLFKDFFSFDSSRLFNETLVYYNHVYSFVLSQMNDEEKLLVTKLAILNDKKYLHNSNHKK